LDFGPPCHRGTYTHIPPSEGVERFLITDINSPATGARAQSEVVVMWDQVARRGQMFNHAPGGSNVLFMDGHVEFMRYEGGLGAFPVNEAGQVFHELAMGHMHGGHGH
jgi:prepilin-type processing-associated H-X9-DG protein